MTAPAIPPTPAPITVPARRSLSHARLPIRPASDGAKQSADDPAFLVALNTLRACVAFGEPGFAVERDGICGVSHGVGRVRVLVVAILMRDLRAVFAFHALANPTGARDGLDTFAICDRIGGGILFRKRFIACRDVGRVLSEGAASAKCHQADRGCGHEALGVLL